MKSPSFRFIIVVLLIAMIINYFNTGVLLVMLVTACLLLGANVLDKIKKSEHNEESNEKFVSKRDEFFNGNYLKRAKEEKMGIMRELDDVFTINIDYVNKFGNFSSRKVDVIALTTFNGTLYILTYCNMQDDVRTFLIEKIEKIIDEDGVIYEKVDIINFFRDMVIPKLKNERNKKIVENCLSEIKESNSIFREIPERKFR